MNRFMMFALIAMVFTTLVAPTLVHADALADALAKVRAANANNNGQTYNVQGTVNVTPAPQLAAAAAPTPNVGNLSHSFNGNVVALRADVANNVGLATPHARVSFRVGANRAFADLPMTQANGLWVVEAQAPANVSFVKVTFGPGGEGEFYAGTLGGDDQPNYIPHSGDPGADFGWRRTANGWVPSKN